MFLQQRRPLLQGARKANRFQRLNPGCKVVGNSKGMSSTVNAQEQPALVAHLQALSDQTRESLLKNLDAVDLEEVRRIFDCSKAAAGPSTAPTPLHAGDVATLQGRSQEDVDLWTRTGMQLLAEGKAAVLLLAGGQGTRLGSSAPKGCYDIGLPSRKSLFQLQAERLLRLQALAQQHTAPAPSDLSEPSTSGGGTHPIMWYIMTSPMTHADTLQHFEAHGFFGLLREQVFFFPQGTLLCLTPDGQVILETSTQIATAPDGNGGVYKALRDSGALQHMAQRGIECLDCYCVDNALARVADPLFLGCCYVSGAECGARVLPKAHPQEKVGVFARRGERFAVVEYSELDPTDAASTLPGSGELKYNWSNICMHYFHVDWLAQVTDRLQQAATYHIARKKIPSKDGPVDGIKLEQFIFDTFPMAEKVRLMEVARSEEFSPVKNAPAPPDEPLAPDSPDTARAHVLALHKKWVERAGAAVQSEAGVEVSPLVSYAGEGLETICNGLVITSVHCSALQDPP